MNQPNLFIIGAPKCGTTAWYSYLGQHPDINFSEAKEPHFFCKDFPNFCWAKNLCDYNELFSNLPKSKYIGEASVMYLYSEVAIKNIFKFNPNAKLLAFIRSPESFFVSYHSQIYLSLDEEVEAPEVAWNLQAARKNGQQLPKNCREPKFLQYRDVCRFGHQLQRVRDYFPADQLKLILFEEWTKDPHSTYAEIMKFLELPNNGFSDFRQINSKRENRYRWLGQLVRRPPAFLLSAASLTKRLLGLNRLGFASRVRQLNEREKRNHAQLSDRFKKQLYLELADDRLKLESLLGHPIDSWNRHQAPRTNPESDIAAKAPIGEKR